METSYHIFKAKKYFGNQSVTESKDGQTADMGEYMKHKMIKSRLSPEMKQELSEAAKKVMFEAERVIRMRFPFFSYFLNTLPLVEDWEAETMYTNGHVIGYNPYFTLSQLKNLKQIVFVVMHEILHCAFAHHLRMGNKQHGLWNEATDYIINLTLSKMLDEKKTYKSYMEIPYGVGILLKYKYEGMSDDQVYHILNTGEDKKQNQSGGSESSQGNPQQGDNNPGQSGGSVQSNNSGSHPKDSSDTEGFDKVKKPTQGKKGPDDENETQSGKSDEERDYIDGMGSQGNQMGDEQEGDENQDVDTNQNNGEPDDGQPGDDSVRGDVKKPNPKISNNKNTAEQWKKETMRAAKNAGKDLPDYLRELIENFLEPQVDWKNKLRNIMSDISVKYERKYVNKRLVNRGIYLKKMKRQRDIGDLFIAVDISGSVSYEALKQFGSEIKSISSKINFDRLIICYVDTDINPAEDVKVFKDARDVEFENKQGGGTDFNPPFRFVEEYDIKPAVFIYFTDGGAPDPTPITGHKGSGVKYIWVTVDDPNRVYPFGEKVNISSKSLKK